MNITVLGSGGWGTALAILLADNGHKPTLWSPFAEEIAQLTSTKENKFLSGITLPDTLDYTTDISVVGQADLVLLVTPSFALPKTITLAKPFLKSDTPIVIATKGIEPESRKTFYELLRKILGDDAPLAVLSGPSHAEEVARKIPTACVAASNDEALAALVQNVFMSERFRVYTSTDVIGVELGAALKNVIALAAGISDGLGFGDNTIAALITRGLDEISTLAVALGGKRETLAGLAGLGDLIVTCTSKHSRNRRAGVFIGQGLPVDEAMKEVGAVVEGYYAAAVAYELAQKTGVELPICNGLYATLYEGKNPREVVWDLMTRSRKSELGEALY